MEPLSSEEARAAFIKFFESKGHKFWPSSPVVPYNDPTLLFVNAGMCQYKSIFLGDVDKNTEFGSLKRACNSQKCVRAGGKHNDLEDVGKDVYHHTFFEMLGNWSFGDYFKEEAIDFAWELLTEVYKLPKDRLYATYFRGDEPQNLPPDTLSRDLWLRKLPPSRVLPGSMKENFWEMGDTGPCGPCSEIHYDRIGDRECPELVNADHPDVLEVWNLVFMEFNRESSGKLTTLPAGCVDTGMGLERLVSILNNKRSNYDTDLFEPLFGAIQTACTHCPREYQGKVGLEDDNRIDLAYRAVADHIRTLSIAIADGAIPSNEGRGYVLRRILRRAVRYGRQVLRAPKESIWFADLVDPVVASLGNAFPELKTHRDKVKRIIADEERQFSKTLDRGTTRFFRALQSLAPGDQLDGKTCFDLLATYGFPLDLTEILCEEHGFKVDKVGFVNAMEQHHKNSEGNANRKLVQMLTPDKLALLETELRVPRTDDSAKYEWNPLGDGPEFPATVMAIYDGQRFRNEIESSDATITLVLDRSNFYAESGGQVGDTGFGTIARGRAEIVILDTRKMGPYVLHLVRVSEGILSAKDPITLAVDFHRRSQIARNHTGTHVLNFVLRKILGEGVDQAGSIVEPSRLRFDFSAPAALTPAQIAAVETEIRDIIAQDLRVYSKEVRLAAARSIPGVRCLFGENYPDPVRVVSVGVPIETLVYKSSTCPAECAVEFCGGTHLHQTGTMQDFVIISEESIARGIRRIVAATGDAAVECRQRGTTLLSQFEAASRAMDGEEFNRLRDAMNAEKDLLPALTRKQCTEMLEVFNAKKLEEAKAKQKALKKTGEEFGRQLAAKGAKEGSRFFVEIAPALNGDFKAMEEALTQVTRALDVPVLLLSHEDGGLAKALASVPDRLSLQLQASQWVSGALSVVNGKGGGKAVSARGTCPPTSNLELAAAEAIRLAAAFL
eukprot:Gregarina_sp_Poly_1__2703@NODE_1744_length_3422_cov_141_543368_g639_i1_p1_GENE_NODE_1744_length_3422_cov_141_543368_g639_i1NODE_1744_length_3422_cov_141_543368_g639_i1_p1_ORF_typecomplete_len953_score185_92tRNAsynt_2c/PF01411_19/2_2e193tRNAsynt_2c/PF01411_19/57tRNA_SAD/PF07973_14/1_7e04tRNA_SAD/PF07973_14/3_3e11DUF917/PF06032_12/0_094FKBP_N/PF01346_18/0_16_NODE_1744_length_3422_cov_141_543368_g639_i14513309